MTQAGLAEKQVDSSERQLVVFDLAGEAYGIEINEVREIIRVQEVTKTPQAPWFVVGLINLRGKVIPVVDLRKRFGLEVSAATNDTRIVVVDIQNTDIGMIVDSVNEVRRVPAAAIEPPSSVVSSRDSEYIMGIAKTEDKMIILLDLQQVLDGASETPPPLPLSHSNGHEEKPPGGDEEATTLYEELGGEPAVTAAVDQLYQRILADATLKPFFDEGRIDGLKKQQRAFITQALGGPAQYQGQSMSEAHAGMGITDDHFDRVAGHLSDTLAGLGVGDELAARVLAVVASLRSEIVQAHETPPQSPAA
ncbi:MAG: chemotaxis protein CheW [Dehalococcoidia bacterium]